MRIHHLNCISTCPLGGSLMDGHTRSLRGRLTCHCLLVETDDQLVLIDTGFGLRDVRDPRSRLSRFFLWQLRPELREEMTAIRQIKRLGYDPRDVRTIVLTHLDFDHAGGLDDFPEAEVHMLGRERRAAEARPTWLDKQRYRPQQWSTRSNWRVHRTGEGEPWFGFDCVRDVGDTGGDVLLVPLIGHTLGHAGVAVRRPDRWLLLAGDAYFYHREMDLEDPYCTPGLRLYQRMMEKDRAARLRNQERLRQLKRRHDDEVEILCSHDEAEFERAAGRPATEPAPRGPGRERSIAAHPVPPAA